MFRFIYDKRSSDLVACKTNIYRWKRQENLCVSPGFSDYVAMRDIIERSQIASFGALIGGLTIGYLTKFSSPWILGIASIVLISTPLVSSKFYHMTNGMLVGAYETARSNSDDFECRLWKAELEYKSKPFKVQDLFWRFCDVIEGFFRVPCLNPPVSRNDEIIDNFFNSDFDRRRITYGIATGIKTLLLGYVGYQLFSTFTNPGYTLKRNFGLAGLCLVLGFDTICDLYALSTMKKYTEEEMKIAKVFFS